MRDYEGIECASQESGVPHEWLVIGQGPGLSLHVRCERCGREGWVPDASAAESTSAVGAATRPYAWGDGERVKQFPVSWAGQLFLSAVWPNFRLEQEPS
jgi:hypothetical protein